MKVTVLRVGTLIGVLVSLVLALVLLGAAALGVPVLSGVGYFVCASFMMSLIPLLLSRAVVLGTGIRTWRWQAQILVLTLSWSVTFAVVFALFPLLGVVGIGGVGIGAVGIGAAVATALMLLIHAAIWGALSASALVSG